MSAYGVVHKRQTVPDWLAPALPGTTVRAYDNSKRNKTEAAAQNFAAKTGVGAAGGGLGILAAGKLLPRVKGFRGATALPFGRMLSADKKIGFGASVVGGGVGGTAGAYAGNKSLKRIKSDPKYGYRRSR